jgi:hypothetical protein
MVLGPVGSADAVGSLLLPPAALPPPRIAAADGLDGPDVDGRIPAPAPAPAPAAAAAIDDGIIGSYEASPGPISVPPAAAAAAAAPKPLPSPSPAAAAAADEARVVSAHAAAASARAASSAAAASSATAASSAAAAAHPAAARSASAAAAAAALAAENDALGPRWDDETDPLAQVGGWASTRVLQYPVAVPGEYPVSTR